MRTFCAIAYWIGVAAMCLCVLPLAVLGMVLKSMQKLLRKARS